MAESISRKATREATNSWRMLDTAAFLVLFVSLFGLLGRGTFYTSDEGGIFNTALALMERGSLAIAPGENVHLGRDNRYYACREILPTLASVPISMAGMMIDRIVQPGPPPVAPTGGRLDGTCWPVFLSVTLLGPLAVAFTLWLLHAFVLLEGGGRSEALWLALVAGLATPLAFYAKTIFPQVFEAAWLMLAFLAAAQWRRTEAPAASWRLGLACGLGLMTRAAFLPVSLWFFGFLLVAGQANGKTRLGSVVRFLIPVLLGGAVTAWVNWQRWGSPLDFGYHHSYESFTANAWMGLYGLLASPGKGLWVYAPVLLVLLVCARSLWRRGRAEFLLLLGISATYLAIYCRWFDWPGGLAWGPRFLVALIPPWAALLGRALADPSQRLAHRLILVTVPLGLAVQFLGITIHPQWMNNKDPDPFSLTHSHLVEYGRVLLETGPDDLWLWSGAGNGSPVLAGVALTLVAALLLSALVLWRRAGSVSERLATQLPLGLACLMLVGVFICPPCSIHLQRGADRTTDLARSATQR